MGALGLVRLKTAVDIVINVGETSEDKLSQRSINLRATYY